MKKYLLIFLIFSFLEPEANSQETQTTKLNELDFLLRTWKIDAGSRLSAEGPWEKTSGISVIKNKLNSTIIEEEFTGTRQGKSFLNKTLFGINNMNNKLQRVFADSEHGVLIEFEGEKSKDTIYFDKTWTYASGSTMKLRAAYYIISEDEFRVETMRMPQNATEWDITSRVKYNRIKK